ncbi:HNH endonuclease [Halosolutus halophilus]|uniref:HNH endonuclease n=1 Tax=Halosolutus halophilus TaxID=1552990 RepID=UPI002234FCEE|nr:HNH endonuclease [Halosolutus halophilus]
MSTDPDLFIAPCSREHKETTIQYFRETVLEGVSPETYPSIEDIGYDESISVWGAISSNESTWAQMEKEDIVLFYTKSGVYTHCGIIDRTYTDEELARNIWAPYDEGRTVEDIEDPWLHMFFLQEVTKVDLPADDLHDALGYDMDYPLSFMRPSDTAHSRLRTEFGSVRSFLDRYIPESGSSDPSEDADASSADRDTSPSESKSGGVDREEKSADLRPPDRIETTVSRIIRNTTLAKNLKDRYDYECQVCGDHRKRSSIDRYAEVHHVKPLGNSDPGPDSEENILVLCPNHHADFDYGMIEVDPDTMTLSHAYESNLDGRKLTVHSDHELSKRYLEYHNSEIARL